MLLHAIALALLQLTVPGAVVERAMPTNHARKFVKNGYILEVAALNRTFDVPFLEQDLHLHVDAHAEKILEQFPGSSIRHLFKSELFTGLSIQLDETVSLSDLISIPGIISINPIGIIIHPNPGKKQPLKRGPTPPSHLTGAPPVPAPPPAVYKNGVYSPHVQTEITKLHDLGLLGSPDIRVGIIDSGVDFNNKLLGGGFGKGYHIAFGTDFVGDDGTPGSTPYGSCQPHGTHCTGIIGSYFDADMKFSGGSPNVSLGHYRVVGCASEGAEDVIIAAILQASKDGCSVISMSFSLSDPWSSSVMSTVTKRAGESGSLIVAAAGNDGLQGMFAAMAPGDLPGVLAVGSVDVSNNPVGYTFKFVGASFPALTYFSALPVDIKDTLDVYFLSTDLETDKSCGPLPTDLPADLSKTLLVVRRGACSKAVILHLATQGARIILDYGLPAQDSDGFLATMYKTGTVQGLKYLLRVPSFTGTTLLEHYKASNGKLRVTFAGQERALDKDLSNPLTGGLISIFSEYGPTADLEHPNVHLLAPGTNILSTFPLQLGGIGVDTGTSMSAPLVSSIAALLFSHRKADRLTPSQVKSLLSTTAQPVAVAKGLNQALATTIRQGGGLVSAYRAYIAKTFIEPAQIALKDPKNFVRSHVITLKNTNHHAATYTFHSIAAQTLGTYDKVPLQGDLVAGAGSDINPSTTPEPIQGEAKVTFSPSHLVIPPGVHATTTVTFTRPEFNPSDQQRLPIYSGWLLINSTDDPIQSYRISYFGLGSNLVDVVPILDTTSLIGNELFHIKGLKFPFITKGSSTNPPSSVDDILFADSSKTAVTSVTRKEGITVYLRFAMSTRYAQIDVIEADTPFFPTIPTDNNADLGGTTSSSSSLKKMTKRAQSSTSSTDEGNPNLFKSVPIVGNLWSSNNIARNNLQSAEHPLPYHSMTLNGIVAKSPLPGVGGNDEQIDLISNTPYRLLIRAQKLESDATLSTSYESWVSGIFEFTD